MKNVLSMVFTAWKTRKYEFLVKNQIFICIKISELFFLGHLQFGQLLRKSRKFVYIFDLPKKKSLGSLSYSMLDLSCRCEGNQMRHCNIMQFSKNFSYILKINKLSRAWIEKRYKVSTKKLRFIFRRQWQTTIGKTWVSLSLFEEKCWRWASIASF